MIAISYKFELLLRIAHVKRLITRCFEPDSIDLMKPLAVDDQDDDDIDVVSLTIAYAISPYRLLQLTGRIIENGAGNTYYINNTV